MTEAIQRAATRMVPLELGLINEGNFLDELNAAIRNAQQQLVKFSKAHGIKAKKAKVVITAQIALVCLEPEQDAYACVPQVKVSLPSTPATPSLLMGGVTQTDEDCLLCRKSGSGSDTPAQKVFATQDGRDVDTATGEVG